MVTSEDKDLLNDLFLRSEDDPRYDSPDDILETPTLIIDLDEVNGTARQKAEEITEKLSDYYFDQKYITEHPYIPNKIAQEIDNIRLLLKMLSINEKAQDTLITNITMNAGKGALYQSLTSLQKSMLDIQKQLNDVVKDVENIFREMQAETDKTFSDKDKEYNSNSGSYTVRGSKEFIESLKNYKTTMNIKTIDGEKVDLSTGEVLAEDMLQKEIAS